MMPAQPSYLKYEQYIEFVKVNKNAAPDTISNYQNSLKTCKMDGFEPAKVAEVWKALLEKLNAGVSYGAGVDSTMVFLLALQKGLPVDYMVVADPGDEMPESYKYLDYMRPLIESKGIQLIVVKPKDGRSLSQRCRDRKVIPSTRWRWCTRDTKIHPIHTFYRKLGQPIVQYIGFDVKERRRINKVSKRKDKPGLQITNVYPLYDYGIDRETCEKAIAQAGLTVPIKSSCTFCPFKTTEQWVYLYWNHRDKYYEAMAMEEANKYFPRQRLFIIPLRELEQLILAGKPLPKSRRSDNCGSL